MAELKHAVNATGLADILERVLDKGIVIAGDIKIQIADIDLLTIKIRLLIASVDKAMEMGINWWQEDPYLSTKAKDKEQQILRDDLQQRVEKLEAMTKTTENMVAFITGMPCTILAVLLRKGGIYRPLRSLKNSQKRWAEYMLPEEK